MQRVDPAVVPLHASQTRQMSQQARHAARHTSDRLEEDAASQYLLHGGYAEHPAAQQVKVEANGANGVVSQRVECRLGCAMYGVDADDLLGLPQRVGQRVSVLDLREYGGARRALVGAADGFGSGR